MNILKRHYHKFIILVVLCFVFIFLLGDSVVLRYLNIKGTKQGLVIFDHGEKIEDIIGSNIRIENLSLSNDLLSSTLFTSLGGFDLHCEELAPNSKPSNREQI
jgi:hypothetical protein